MTNFRIEFVYPWLLLLLIPAAVLTLLPYFKLSKKYRKNRNRITSIVLHSIIMVLAIFILSGMTFSYQTPNTENEIILLVDMSQIMQGLPRSIICKAKERFRSRQVASQTITVRSMPSSFKIFKAISSSGVRVSREYVPGTSIQQMLFSPTEKNPSAISTVFPDQLPVCWSRPVKALKSVLLPTLGLPTRAIFRSHSV